jgi:hypothetical protein
MIIDSFGSSYFTQICVSGLINDRKLELTHMLLKDINIFYMHPIEMPNMNENDQDSLLINEETKNLPKKVPNEAEIPFSPSIKNNNHQKQKQILLPDIRLRRCSKSTTDISSLLIDSKREQAKLNEKIAIVELDQFLSKRKRQLMEKAADYSLGRKSFHPIRNESSLSSYATVNCCTSERGINHNINYIPLEMMNNEDDVQQIDLQFLHNGLTFVGLLNELDVMQSNFLLNIRLESDNATLIWSKPAWNITDAWANSSNSNQVIEL